jgi:putative acetyltransferase
MTLIREATNQDCDNICEVYMQAFDKGEAKSVAALASKLLNEETIPKTISKVAEINGKVVGHIAFSPVTFDADKILTGYILAPLGIKPEYQKRRVGSRLIKNGIEQLSREGVCLIFVYGDPKYYSKFGFNEKTAARFLPPYKLQYPFGWLALALNEVCSGEYTTKVTCVAPLSDPTLW